MKAPLFRDPIFDGAADPTLIWNRAAKEWWMVYTNRRATAEGTGVAWVHGTDLGVASSKDSGQSWVYRGVLPGLDIEWGRNTFWAPEIIWHEDRYHMYVSYIQGVPDRWEGFRRDILHYTSPDLLKWTFCSKLELSSDRVIDACIYPLQAAGGFRMWYKDEADHSYIYAADSPDLYEWKVVGPVLTGRGQEGPNVFRFKGFYWLIVDEWRGQGVYRSSDLQNWERNNLILDQPGHREEDDVIGQHADVVVQGGSQVAGASAGEGEGENENANAGGDGDDEEAYIFYFTHPGRKGEETSPDQSYARRRSSIQVARLEVKEGVLECNRDEQFRLSLKPE